MSRNSVKAQLIVRDWPAGKDIILGHLERKFREIRAGRCRHSLRVAVDWWNRFDHASAEGASCFMARVPKWIIAEI